MPTDRRSPLLTYGLAILSVSAVLTIRLLGWSYFGAEVPFLFFFSALSLAGWYGGFGPGALATWLSTLLVAYYFLVPNRDLRDLRGHDILHLCIYLLTGTLISWLMGKLHSARARSEEAESRMEQRAAEAEESKRILEAMMEHIPAGIAIADASDGTVRKVSRSWCDLIGRKRAEVEGVSLESLLDRRHEARPDAGPNEEGMEKLPLVKALRRGEVIREQEWALKKSDGTVVPVLCEAGPIRDKAGNPALAVISWHDITERRRMEQGLRKAHAELETRVRLRTAELARSNQALQLERNKLLNILSSMRESVYIVDRQNEIEFVNPAFEREFGPLIPGTKCYEKLHGRTEVCPWCLIPEVIEGKSIASEWTSAVNGKVYDVFDTPLINHDGSISKLKILHDITEHRRAEQALKESEEELRRLSSELLTAQEAERARISRELHDELGQTLTLAKMRIGLLEMGLAGDQRQLRDHCESASSHVDQAIESVRRLSRDLRPALLESLGVTSALKRLVSEAAKASDIEISAEIEDIDYLCSPQSCILLYRVVQEMLTNLMKHSEATRASVSAKRKNGQVVFQIEDNGIGMDIEEVESRRKAGKHGMGLSMMRERVRTLGGSLEIWSQRGKGTRLSFSVPSEVQGGLK